MAADPDHMQKSRSDLKATLGRAVWGFRQLSPGRTYESAYKTFQSLSDDSKNEFSSSWNKAFLKRHTIDDFPLTDSDMM